MRYEHFTVGLVADGTETLEPAPVTEQDAFVTEREQICAYPEQATGRIRIIENVKAREPVGPERGMSETGTISAL